MMKKQIMPSERQGLIQSKRVSLAKATILSCIIISHVGCLAGLGELSETPESLRVTPRGDGPTVIYNFLAKPLPEIPLPNDDATIFARGTATQRRINVSYDAATEVERRAREAFNGLDGFGSYAPITVSFDQAIDVIDLYERHNLHDPDSGHYRDDFRDDAVFVFNIDPQCERYSEEVALDIGRGRFPATLFKHIMSTKDELAPGGLSYDFDDLFYFSSFDSHAMANNLLYEEWNEDLNNNGILDEGEDRDGDGHLDVANLLHPNACDDFTEGTVERQRCIADELMTFYERESNTLILRPVWPLEQGCRYAVVLTDRLKGEDGEPVQSPFEGINPAGQTAALKVIEDWLGRYELSPDDIAFAWTFTVGSQTKDLEALRAGLYGSGVFSSLSEEFPVEGLHLWKRRELDPQGMLPESVRDDRYLPGACSGLGLSKFWQVRGEWDANLCAIEADYSGLAMVFGGKFLAPDLLVNRDKNQPATPNYPQTSDERWEIDSVKGSAVYGKTEVTFWCGLPIERDQSCSPGNPEAKPFCKPFPTILYAHGYGGSRAEITVGHLGRTTSMGYAMCALDAYGHGLNALLSDHPAVQDESLAFRILDTFGIPDFQQLLMRGRDRDLNNDGLQDSGADMWTSDIFHTRDMVRQTSLEYIQFVRILRSFNGEQRDKDGELLGDIDGDGVIDLGGPETSIGMWGISLGGIISGVLAGAEPSLDAVSPNAGGAGLVDIAVRSSQQGVPQAVMLPVLGPFIVGCTAMDDHQRAITEGEGDSCFRSQGYTLNPKGGDPLPSGQRARLSVGELELAYVLNNNARQREISFAKLTHVSPGDWIEVENLDNGEVKRRPVDARGRVMISIPADALTAPEKRNLIGLKDGDRDPVPFSETQKLGDRLVIRHFKADVVKAHTVRDERGEFDVRERLDGDPAFTLSHFMWPAEFQGAIYPANATLIALQEGLALDRNSPQYRRFMGLAQSAIGPGDPAIWSEKIGISPLKIDYDRYQGGHTHVLQMPTVGDTQVPTNTGISAARISGNLGSWKRNEEEFPDPRFGWRELFQPLPDDEQRGGHLNSADQLLLDRYVVEGDSQLQRWSMEVEEEGMVYKVQTEDGEALHPYVLFDIDNMSGGEARFSCSLDDWSAMNGEYFCPDDWKDNGQVFPVPYDREGLRLTKEREKGRYDALRVPLLRPTGQHGIYNAQPFRVFDNDAYMVNFTTRYLASRGMLVDQPEGCDCSASEIPSYELNGRPFYPVKRNEACEPNDLHLCNSECAESWGIITQPLVECITP